MGDIADWHLEQMYMTDEFFEEEDDYMATKSFTGELVRLNSREVNGRTGPIKAWSGKVQKPDGEEYDEWVGFGFKKPPCNQGDSVVILAKKENGFWKAVDVEVTKEATAAGDEDETASESSASGSSRAANSSARPVSSSKSSSKNSQEIHYQNSRTAAIQLADLLIRSKAAPISSADTKVGVAKRFEEVTALVNKLTVTLYHDLETFRLVKDIEDAYEAPAKADAEFDGDDGAEEGDGQDD
jgi:hypothetical protein